MTKFYVEPDGADEPTIWEDMRGHAAAVVVRRAELPGPYTDLLWSVLVAALTAEDVMTEWGHLSKQRTVKVWPSEADARRRAEAIKRPVVKRTVTPWREVQ